jgi:hypothetical protein
MKIVVESRLVPGGTPGLVRHQENLEENPNYGKDEALLALMTAGMSEQTALEQIMRLSAGDIWSG